MGATSEDDDDSVSAMDLLRKVQHRMESQRNLVSQSNMDASMKSTSSRRRKSSIAVSPGRRSSTTTPTKMSSSGRGSSTIGTAGSKSSTSPPRDITISTEEKKSDEEHLDHDEEFANHDDTNDDVNAEREEGDEDEDDEEEEDEEEEDHPDMDASDLLEAVRGRMEQQKFMDEVKDLRKMLSDKDEEIKTLKGQLQMAISTKHSLMIANNELEQQHQRDMETSTQFEEDLQRSSRVHMNVRAEIEKDFLNDLMQMAKQLQSREEELSKKEDTICKLEAQLTQKRIREEQCTDCVEKDETIKCLQEKVHRLEKLVPKQETNKVRFYKQKLGL